jgi:type II secretory pathway pseudopilin PulG
MDIKKIVLTIAMLVAVLMILALLLSMLTEGPLQIYQEKEGECQKQENAADCRSITEDAGGQEREQCFWDAETETCNPRVR